MAAPKTSTKPRFAVVGDKLIAQTTEGELKIPLRVKTKLIRKIRALPGDQIDQFFALIDGIGDKKTSAQIDELDFITETAPLVEAFFDAWGEAQDATPGESSSSSTSSRSTDQPSDSTSDTSSD